MILGIGNERGSRTEFLVFLTSLRDSDSLNDVYRSDKIRINLKRKESINMVAPVEKLTLPSPILSFRPESAL